VADGINGYLDVANLEVGAVRRLISSAVMQFLNFEVERLLSVERDGNSLDHSPMTPALVQIRRTSETPDLLTGLHISVYHSIQIEVA
jgi:hypothetical protein